MTLFLLSLFDLFIFISYLCVILFCFYDSLCIVAHGDSQANRLTKEKEFAFDAGLKKFMPGIIYSN